MNSSKQRFSSNAFWPEGVVSTFNNETTDYHFTKEEAQSVCDRLEREGFLGTREQFPIKTWVDHDK